MCIRDRIEALPAKPTAQVVDVTDSDPGFVVKNSRGNNVARLVKQIKSDFAEVKVKTTPVTTTRVSVMSATIGKLFRPEMLGPGGRPPVRQRIVRVSSAPSVSKMKPEAEKLIQSQRDLADGNEILQKTRPAGPKNRRPPTLKRLKRKETELRNTILLADIAESSSPSKPNDEQADDELSTSIAFFGQIEDPKSFK
eukprot:TRINITY_DN7222_c0_g1_i1.p1 TRINITY_DN7222_c0_g1~~TRINITY_DN7222_c0_g1_i1.p1  ORF type:complete len:196 (-),score=28.92 TRINITY_DN7222_c0_g1_i1:406-993(-)